jgi:hypothetical protein
MGDTMESNLNHAIDHALEMTNYNLEGNAWKVELEDTWYVIFNTPAEEATPDTMQVLHIEIMLMDGGVVASVLKQENMSDRRVSRLMDCLMDAINISEEDDMPALETGDPQTPVLQD